jgi:haloacetate dehalogenase
MWRASAPQLARDFTVVCADLRGYGQSACPPSDDDHLAYSKRVMARDMVRAMELLGFDRFAVAGHDRGGRVAYRMALDHPDRIVGAAVLDIVPTETAWRHADDAFAIGYWPWSLLAQRAPLPERMLEAAAEAVVNEALDGWGSAGDVFPPSVRAAYVGALRDRDHSHAICEEYRAAAAVDREHDQRDRASGRTIQCPLLVLWSGIGPLATWYAEQGGPLRVWNDWAAHVEGHEIDAGHFFPEERPDETVAALRGFFLGGR